MSRIRAATDIIGTTLQAKQSEYSRRDYSLLKYATGLLLAIFLLLQLFNLVSVLSGRTEQVPIASIHLRTQEVRSSFIRYYALYYADNCIHLTFLDPQICDIWKRFLQSYRLKSPLISINGQIERGSLTCEFSFSDGILAGSISNCGLVVVSLPTYRLENLTYYTVYSFFDEIVNLSKKFYQSDSGNSFLIFFLSFASISRLPLDLQLIIYHLSLNQLHLRNNIHFIFDKDYESSLLSGGGGHSLDHPPFQNNITESFHDRCSILVNTRKYNSLCFPELRLQHSSVLAIYPLLITGLGGAGTHFITHELQKLGFRIAHENLDAAGSVSWLYAVNDEVLNLTYPFGRLVDRNYPFLVPRFSHVIHVIRHPLKQIASFTAHTNKTYTFSYLHLKQFIEHQSFQLTTRFSSNQELLSTVRSSHLQQKNCLRGAKCHLHYASFAWLLWNRMVESYADVSYKIEDKKILNTACEYLWPGFTSAAGRSCVDERKHYLSMHPIKSLYNSIRLKPIKNTSNIRNHHVFCKEDIDGLDRRLFLEIEADLVKWKYEWSH